MAYAIYDEIGAQLGFNYYYFLGTLSVRAFSISNYL